MPGANARMCRPDAEWRARLAQPSDQRRSIYFKNWDYAGLIDAWNADDGHGLGLTATTGGELADAISKVREHKGGPVLIECQTAHDDCSPQLVEWGARVARANTRPHQTN
jgi:TPP-dependent 2-oxoacid decarboxylase